MKETSKGLKDVGKGEKKPTDRNVKFDKDTEMKKNKMEKTESLNGQKDKKSDDEAKKLPAQKNAKMDTDAMQARRDEIRKRRG